MEAVVLQDPDSLDRRPLNIDGVDDRDWKRAMDKARLARIINSANVEAITIPSTASRQERERQIRDFVRKAEKVQDGEVVLVIVRT